MSKKTLEFNLTLPQVVDTITIELPYFCRPKGRSYMGHCVINDNTVLNVLISKGGGLISTSDDVHKLLNNFDIEPMTRQEFVEMYAQITDSFTQILPYDGHNDN